MKNSLFLLIQSIEALSECLDEKNAVARKQVSNVHYEASRLNTNLVQILSLYRAELESLPITVDECFVKDLLEDVVGSNTLYVKEKNISVNISADEDLAWYLDSELFFLLLKALQQSVIDWHNLYYNPAEHSPAYIGSKSLELLWTDKS